MDLGRGRGLAVVGRPGRGGPREAPELVSQSDRCETSQRGKILTVATGGGGNGAVAAISIEDRSVIAYASAGKSPHSVVGLPGGRILTASSNDNLLRLFGPARNGRFPAVQDLELDDAHGLVWDPERRCAWALGGKQMQLLVFSTGGDTLRVDDSIDLPVTERSRRHERHGGHDLVWNPDGNRLLLSDMDDLWAFDPEAERFHPLVKGPVPMVKSLSPARSPDPFLILWATEQWWSDTVRSLENQHRFRMPGARFYKARWIEWDPSLGVIPRE